MVLGVDSDLDHISYISDEEGNRFQIPGLIIGQLLPQHRGGTLLNVGVRPVEHLRGQALRRGAAALPAGPQADLRPGAGHRRLHGRSPGIN